MARRRPTGLDPEPKGWTVPSSHRVSGSVPVSTPWGLREPSETPESVVVGRRPRPGTTPETPVPEVRGTREKSHGQDGRVSSPGDVIGTTTEMGNPHPFDSGSLPNERSGVTPGSSTEVGALRA